MNAARPTSVPEGQPRIVSLIASATEIVHELGFGACQVGRSHECDWPPAVVALPQLTRPRFKLEGGSRAIDMAVRDLIENALAVYDVDRETLRSVQPEVIITQDQCVVCAVSLADVERAVCDLTGLSARVVALNPQSMADVYRDIQTVANALCAEARGQDLIARMQRRLERIAQRTSGPDQPRVAFIEWMDPLMSCGHWMPELCASAGGQTIFGETGQNSPTLSWDEFIASDPDVIVIAPCGYDLRQTMQEVATLTAHPRWAGLRAVVEGQTYVADGNAFFNRPGPRLVESAEILAEILHPDRCNFNHAGHAYVSLQSASP